MLEGRAAQVTAAVTEIPPPTVPAAIPGPGRLVRDRRADAAGRAQRRVLPDRHRADHPGRRARRLDAAGLRDGRQGGHAHVRRADAAAAGRAVRDDRLREQRGRRQPRRQREVDRRAPRRRARDGGRPAGRDADRPPLGRRLDRRLPDRVGHRPEPSARGDDRRQDERRAAARGARVPGPADRPRPVRLRVGDEVAGRDRAHDPRGVRRLLGAARLGEAGADPDPVPDRRAASPARRWRRASSRSRAWRGPRIAASRRSRSRSTAAPGRRRRWPPRSGRRRGSSGRSPWQATPGNHVIEVRATDGTGEVQTAQVSPPPPDGARGYHQIAVQVG